MGDEILCLQCAKQLQDSDDRCPHCGVNRVAPSCPQCGQPVTTARDKRVYYRHHNGGYPWHHQYHGTCAACGHSFTANLHLRTGHTIFFTEKREEALAAMKSDEKTADPFASISDIAIRGSESVYMMCDDWNHQPTIEVVVKRAVAANSGKSDEGLAQEARVVLTPQEWSTIAAQLEGPLKVLMQRQPWSEDTT